MMESEKHLPMTKAQAELEFVLMQAEADSMSSSDLYIWLTESGLPSEVAIRVRELVNATMRIAGKIVSIGKIIVIKLIEFVKAHPSLAVGVAIGAAISLLIGSIPFIGGFLAPIALAIEAIAGHRLDMGRREGGWIIKISQDIIEITKMFFQVFIDVFLALKNEIQAEPV